MKKGTTLHIVILMMALALGTYTPAVVAQTATAPAAGDGSSGSPYQIAGLENLYWIAENNARWAYNYIQTANIDASATSGWFSGSGWTPIGDATNNFTGSYNGQNHTISNLTINRPSTNYVGLFGYANGATLSHLNLSGFTITGNMMVGALAGRSYESSVSYMTTSGSVNGYISSGGLIGNAYSGSVTNSQNAASVSGNSYIGGVIGQSSGCSVTDCRNSGAVSGSGQYIGGLIGEHTIETVNRCANTGTVTVSSTPSYIGGLIGGIGLLADVTHSYNNGIVNGYRFTGGLAGRNDTGNIGNCYSTGTVSGYSNVGGLVGQNGGIIDNCYSSGQVSATDSWYGGLTGSGGTSSVNNCFWDTEASGQSSSAAGTGKTTGEMKTVDTFTDVSTAGLTTAWDFETNPNDDAANNNWWDLDYSGAINSGYPYLSWQDGSNVSLPVELASFSAVYDRGSVILEWVSESEVDNLGYILERKTERDADWIRIASYRTHSELKGQGNTSSRTGYRFVDANVRPGETYSYRLSDVDTQGRTTVKDIIVLTLDADLPPLRTELLSTCPNPFNPDAKIQFALAEDTEVTLSVVNTLGQQVKIILNGERKTAGSHSVHWNGRKASGQPAPSGAYILVLKTADVVKTKKVMLMR